MEKTKNTKSKPLPERFWQPGKPYLIRTVTMIDTGVLVSIDDHEVILRDAAWIADTGRFHKALRDPSELNEVEPFPDGLVAIGRGTIIDAVQIVHAPRQVR
jgi:hypothetical protein